MDERPKTGDRFFAQRVQYPELPEGYTIRRGLLLTSSKTSRKLTPHAQGCLREIASVTPLWTAWGEGHATTMYSGACERRRYIEVAVPDKASRRPYLYRATRSGVELVNGWRRDEGLKPLPLPAAPVEAAPARPRVEHQNTNGVKVTVTRSEQGSVVEADCQCFGLPGRIHSREDCPLRLAQMEATRRGPDWPESLTTYELWDAIVAEPDRDRLEMLNGELRARLESQLTPSR